MLHGRDKKRMLNALWSSVQSSKSDGLQTYHYIYKRERTRDKLKGIQLGKGRKGRRNALDRAAI